MTKDLVKVFFLQKFRLCVNCKYTDQKTFFQKYQLWVFVLSKLQIPHFYFIKNIDQFFQCFSNFNHLYVELNGYKKCGNSKNLEKKKRYYEFVRETNRKQFKVEQCLG